VHVVADRLAGLEIGELLAQQQLGDVAEGAGEVVGRVGVEDADLLERRDAPQGRGLGDAPDRRNNGVTITLSE
jgi:hypothetical protein